MSLGLDKSDWPDVDITLQVPDDTFEQLRHGEITLVIPASVHANEYIGLRKIDPVDEDNDEPEAIAQITKTKDLDPNKPDDVETTAATMSALLGLTYDLAKVKKDMLQWTSVSMPFRLMTLRAVHGFEKKNGVGLN